MESGGKLRVYIDTSIPNHLFVDDKPGWLEWTWRLWERCVAGEFEIFVSDVFYRELNRCPQPKLGKMDAQLDLLEIQILKETDGVRELALAYISDGVLKEKDMDDCLHIAHAVVHGCDIILSWNFKHLVNDETKSKVKVVNAISRYNEIGIVSPEEFLMRGYK